MAPEALDVPGQIFRRGVATLGLLDQTAFDDPAERRRQILIGRERRGIVAKDGRESFDRRPLLERLAARGHLVEDHAQGKLVGAEVGGFAPRLLGGHEADGAEDRSRSRQGAVQAGPFLAGRERRRMDLLREPEVEDLDAPLAAHHHVLGLQVAMDQASRVRRRKPVRDLTADLQRLSQRQGPVREQIPKVLPVDELHGDERDRIRESNLVDRHDVGVIQRGRGAGLLLEPAEALRVCGEGGGQHLDRGFAAEPGIPRAVNLSHCPRADGGDDLVRADTCSRGNQLRGFYSVGR
jgi:hypothetical protein